MTAAVMTTHEISSIIVSFDPVKLRKICARWKNHAEQFADDHIVEQFANGFMLGDFDVDCFGVRDDNVRGRTGAHLEMRMRHAIVTESQEVRENELKRYWFMMQLHFNIMVSQQFTGREFGTRAVCYFVDKCLKHHGIFYRSRYLVRRSLVPFQLFPFRIPDLHHLVTRAKLWNDAFVRLRGMGCGALGRSRFEVFDTLIRVAHHGVEHGARSYCADQLCGCQGPPPNIPDNRSP